MVDRRTVLKSMVLAACPALLTRPVAAAPAQAWGMKLVDAGLAQVGVTVLYDPAYVRLDYPGGDVPAERGVCTDVVVRAYRQAFGIDLQRLVNEDMRAGFSAYPKIWAASSRTATSTIAAFPIWRPSSGARARRWMSSTIRRPTIRAIW
jgi:uncharacterized protein YijF (DUF1287 family)